MKKVKIKGIECIMIKQCKKIMDFVEKGEAKFCIEYGKDPNINLEKQEDGIGPELLGDEVKRKFNSTPATGSYVYIIKDLNIKDNNVIYVGKSKSLRDRLRKHLLENLTYKKKTDKYSTSSIIKHIYDKHKSQDLLKLCVYYFEVDPDTLYVAMEGQLINERSV